jgi:preprotein translocase subunit SecF
MAGRLGYSKLRLLSRWELGVEILKSVSVDWLGKKWYFFGLSWILLGLGIVGYFVRGGIAMGIDFKGGTVVYLKFSQLPDLEAIRKVLKPDTVGTTIIQRYGAAADNALMVRMQTVFGAGQDVDTAHKELLKLLRQSFDPEHVNTTLADINNIGAEALAKFLLAADPDKMAGQNKTSQETETHYRSLTRAVIDYRDKVGGGIIGSLNDLKKVEGMTSGAVESLSKAFYTGPFAMTGVESVGAIVGSDLRNRAALAVGLSVLGMLVYIGFRFKPIFGVGAIIALFHDVVITLGLFALTQKEISLTVIAAMLTLVGYSVNDTIVVFDRVRENLRTMRKDSMARVLNLSINQTLSRTIMTSGMTFLSVLALLVFGGEVLSGFSFALTVGIIIGTYSSIAIASPIVEWWYRSEDRKARRKAI